MIAYYNFSLKGYRRKFVNSEIASFLQLFSMYCGLILIGWIPNFVDLIY